MTPIAPLQGSSPHGTATERYAQCRTALVAEQEMPKKDFARIDALIDALETLQLDIKREHRLQGNNPNE